MRVIKSVYGRSRFGRAAGVVRSRRIQYGGGYEEFDGIVAQSTVPEKDSSPARREYQVAALGTPRNAFDVVSEYLTHSSICEESSVKFSDNDVECSLLYSRSATELVPKGENKQPVTNIAQTCRRINGRANVHRQITSRSCSPQTTSFKEPKNPQPLTEVNTNVSAVKSMGYQENGQKPAECASDGSRKACSQSGESNDLTSLSHMRALLIGCTDIRRSISAVGGNSMSKNSFHLAHIGDKDTPTNPNGIKVSDESSSKGSQVPVKEHPIVIVTVTQDTQPASITTERCSSAQQPREGFRDSLEIPSDVHNLIRCTALAGSDLVDNNGLANSSVISHISATVVPPIGTIQSSDWKRAHPVISLKRSRTRRSGSGRLRGCSTLGSVHQLSTAGAIKSKSGIRTRHPFMHFWESEADQVAVNRGWRSRRRAYLSLLCSCPETDRDTVTSNGGRQARRRSDYAGLFYPMRNSGLYSRLRLDNDDVSIAAQNHMLAQLEPVILGYRWSDSDQTPNEANREVMVMWN